MNRIFRWDFLSQAKRASFFLGFCLGMLSFTSADLPASEKEVGSSLEAQRWATAPAFLAPVGGVLLAPRLAAPSRVMLSWLQKVRGVWLAAGVGLGYGLWKASPLVVGGSSLADLSSGVWSIEESAEKSENELMMDRIFEGITHEDFGREKMPPPGPGKGEKLFPFLPQDGDGDRADLRLEEQSLSPELASGVRNHLGSLEKLLTAEGKALPGFTHTMMLALKDLGNQQAQNLLKDKVGALVQKRVESTTEIFNMVEAQVAAMKSVFAIDPFDLLTTDISYFNKEPTDTIGEYLSELMGSLEQVSAMLPLVKSWLSLTLEGVARPEEIEVYFEKLTYETALNPFFRGSSPVSYDQLAGRLYTVTESLEILYETVKARYPDQAAALQFSLAHLDYHLHKAASGLFRFEEVFQNYVLKNPHARAVRHIKVSGYGEDVLGFQYLHKLTGAVAQQLSLVHGSLAMPQWVIPRPIAKIYMYPRVRLSLALSLLADQLAPYILSDEYNAHLLQEGSSRTVDHHWEGVSALTYEYRELGHPFLTISENLDSLAGQGAASSDPFSEESIEEAKKAWRSFSPVVRGKLAQWSAAWDEAWDRAPKWWDEEANSYKELSVLEVEIQKVATALFGIVLSLEKKQAFDEYLRMSLDQRGEYSDVMFNSQAALWESLKFATQGELSFEDEFMQEWQWYLFDALREDLKNDNFLETYTQEEKYQESEHALYSTLPSYLMDIAIAFAGAGEKGWLGLESVYNPPIVVRKPKDRDFDSLEPHQKQSFIQIAKLYPYLRKLGRLAHALGGEVVGAELGEVERVASDFLDRIR